MLLTAGDHEPEMAVPVREELLLELLGNVSAEPLQIGPGLVNVGVTLSTTDMDLVAELEQPALSVTLTLYITLAAVAFMFVGVTVIVDELVGVNPEVAPDGTVCAIH